MCGGAGILAALAGDANTAAMLFAGSEPLSNAAEQVRAVLDAGTAWTILRSAERVQARANKENLRVDTERMEDTLRQSLRPIADAETEEKRHLIEEILLNSARRSSEPAAHVEAQRAMSLIAAMPAHAALTFATLAKLQREYGDDELEFFGWRTIAERCGLRGFIVYEGCEYLALHTPLIKVETECYDTGGKEPEVEIDAIMLTYKGRWLAEWISAHPISATTSSPVGVPPA